MDIFAHTLWTNGVYYTKYANDRRNRYWAAFFGVMPDLVSFVPATVYLLFNRIQVLSAVGGQNAMHVNPESLNQLQTWVFRYAEWSYQYTHSFVTFAVVLLMITLLRRGKIYWPLFGWALHITIDIFTHPDFYRTPFLYPLSNVRNMHAVSWAEPTFMLVNYTLILLVYIGISYYKRKKYGRP